jgi:hypothetical protein
MGSARHFSTPYASVKEDVLQPESVFSCSFVANVGARSAEVAFDVFIGCFVHGPATVYVEVSMLVLM